MELENTKVLRSDGIPEQHISLELLDTTTIRLLAEPDFPLSDLVSVHTLTNQTVSWFQDFSLRRVPLGINIRGIIWKLGNETTIDFGKTLTLSVCKIPVETLSTW